MQTSAHDRHCSVRMSGTYELAAVCKSCHVVCLYSLEHRLSEPEVFASQPKAMELFWAIAGVVCLRVLRQKLVVK